MLDDTVIGVGLIVTTCFFI